MNLIFSFIYVNYLFTFVIANNYANYDTSLIILIINISIMMFIGNR